MLHYAKTILTSLVEDLLRPISGPLGFVLRRAYYRRRLKSCGANLRIDVGVCISNPGMITLGNNVWIDRYVVLLAGPLTRDSQYRMVDHCDGSVASGEIKIGSHSHLGIGTIIQGRGGVEVGDGFTCSAGCTIYSVSNEPSRCRLGTVANDIQPAFFLETPIKMGQNVWLGLHCTVLGCRVGDDCFARPYSVLMGNFPDNGVLAGSPASVVRKRFQDDRVESVR